MTHSPRCVCSILTSVKHSGNLLQSSRCSVVVRCHAVDAGPCMQADLRDFAWTEQGLASKRAQLVRAAHGGDAAQMTVFCFQTAVQAILWSKVAYNFL